jgi:hypothetical protein
MSEKVSGNAIVIADLEIRKRESQAPKDTAR